MLLDEITNDTARFVHNLKTLQSAHLLIVCKNLNSIKNMAKNNLKYFKNYATVQIKVQNIFSHRVMVPDRQPILFRYQLPVFLYKNFHIAGHDNSQCHLFLTAFASLEFLN